MPILTETTKIVIGVDTHRDTHTAAVIDTATGALIETIQVTNDPTGYALLVSTAHKHAVPRAWSIEGTGSYGSGLVRYLREHDDSRLIEIERPERPRRRHAKKTDAIDAARAGRDALQLEYLNEPKHHGKRAAIAGVLAVRRSALQARKIAQQQLHALILTIPETIAVQFRGQKIRAILQHAATIATTSTDDIETQTCVVLLNSLAARHATLDLEVKTHTTTLNSLVVDWRPDLLDEMGVGPITAATILTAWSHPGRCRHEAAFANLAGTAPIPASSGLTNRHRLNRGGDRQLNNAIHTIMLSRQRHDPATIAYMQRRKTEHKTTREIQRSLKRYITRQIFRQLENPPK